MRKYSFQLLIFLNIIVFIENLDKLKSSKINF